jgi:hypothetical protein
MHRVAWDLRYPDVSPTELDGGEELSPWDSPPEGPLVVPGKFSVSMAELKDGVWTSVGEPQTFIVESLGMASMEEKDRNGLLDFQKKAGELQRAMMGAGSASREALRHLQFIKKALLDTPGADPELGHQARELENRLRDIQIELYGDPIIWRRSEPISPSLIRRVSAQLSSTCPITETNKHNYEIAAEDFEKLLESLRQAVEQDLKKLEDKLEAAGAPWTPGRGVPKWKKK